MRSLAGGRWEKTDSLRYIISLWLIFPKKTLADWGKGLAAKELREGSPCRRSTGMTPEGIVVKPVYTATDLEKLETLGSEFGGHAAGLPTV